MAARYNIAALARRTGVAADTLRKWEQRYGVLHPTRTAGGQRRYSETDVARVEWLRARLTEGYRIGEAAALLGDADGEAAQSPAELRDAVYAALRANDAEAVARLADQAFATNSIEEACSEILRPLLDRVGEGWASGELTVAHEHLVTEALRGRLERLLADPRGTVRGVAVLACGPGERHELGLLTLAVLLSADGWHVAYLGADTPVAAALDLARELGARMLAFSVTMPDRVEALSSELEATERPRGLTLVLGGDAVDRALARRLRSRYVDGDLPKAVEALRKLGS